MDRPEKFKKNIPNDNTSFPKLSELNNLKKKTIDDIESLTEKMKNLKLNSGTIHDRNKKQARKTMKNTKELSPPKLPFLGKSKNKAEKEKEKAEKEKMEKEQEKVEKELKTKKELLHLINKYGLNEIINNPDNIPNQDKEHIRKLFQELINKPVYIDRPNKRKTLSKHSNDSSHKKNKKGGKNKHNKTKNRK